MIKDGHPSPQVTPDLNKSSKNWEVLVESPTRDVKGPQEGGRELGRRREGRGANGGENEERGGRLELRKGKACEEKGRSSKSIIRGMAKRRKEGRKEDGRSEI